MRLWRICRRKFVSDAASGEGARLYGGRWNSPGVRTVYTSTSLSLAAMETFVHLEPNLVPSDLVFVALDLPDELPIERLDPKSLPNNWYRLHGEALRKFGDDWIREGKYVALQVPSAAIHGEWNVLLNPAHPDFKRIKITDAEPFEFDLRMFPH